MKTIYFIIIGIIIPFFFTTCYILKKRRDNQFRLWIHVRLHLYEEFIDLQNISEAKVIQKILSESVNNKWDIKLKSRYDRLNKRLEILIQDKNCFEKNIQSLSKRLQTNNFDNYEKDILELEHMRNETKYAFDWNSFDLLKSNILKTVTEKQSAFQSQYELAATYIKEELFEKAKDIIGMLRKKGESSSIYIAFLKDLTILEHELNYKQALYLQKVFKQKIREKDIEQAVELANNIKKTVKNICEENFCRNILKDVGEFETTYKEGIEIETKEKYVLFEPPHFPNNENNYVITKYPKKGTIIFPFRHKQIARRGFLEHFFQQQLQSFLPSPISVVGDASLVVGNGYRPYEPDIAIVYDSPNLNIRIDIEIDEPYSGLTKKPTHYIDCGDNMRDMNMTNLGWIVVRFAEKQIKKEPLNCVAYIASLLKRIDDRFAFHSDILKLPEPTPVERWTEIQAKLMACRKEREKYLENNCFGNVEENQYSSQDILQSDFEKAIAAKVPKLSFSKSFQKPINIDQSNTSFTQDNDIEFEPQEHIYLYKGRETFLPVSNLVNMFFTPFNSYKASSFYGDMQQDILELWDCNGAEAREAGIFLHKQIENHFTGHNVERKMAFTYRGYTITENHIIDISKELVYFKKFLEDHSLKPFRTEWRVFDPRYKVAGTIDLICKNNKGKYDIYDWKRSKKIINKDLSIQKTDQYGKTSINGLKNIPDTSYWHYSLQQNIYRRILEENYGILIDKMYLVVLYHEYPQYQKLEIEYMDNELEVIYKFLKENTISFN